MSHATLADVFDATAARHAARLAVRETRDWSYAELRAWSARITDALAPACGMPGARVGLMMPNSAAYVAAFYAIARAGAVIAPLNVRYRSQELVYYLGDTQAAAVIVPPALLPIVDGHRRDARGAARRSSSSTTTAGARSRAPGAPPSGPRAGPIRRRSFISTPSGSTGAPKRVVRTHAQLLFELERLARLFALDGDDRLLGAAPFTHVNGLVRTMMTSMYVGATLYPVREFRRREVLELVTRERVTYFGAVPSLFVILADTPLRGDVDLASCATVFSASAPLLPADNRRFREKYGHWIRQLYGSTETGTISVNLDADVGGLARVGRTAAPGRPLPRWSTRPAGRCRRRGGRGRIASPGAVTSYDGNPEANAAAFRDGWYWSGDLGRMTADGALTLTGRKKLLINRGGFKVNPLEVEEAIASHAKVREVAVVGAPSGHGDDLVRAVIVTQRAVHGRGDRRPLRHPDRRLQDPEPDRVPRRASQERHLEALASRALTRSRSRYGVPKSPSEAERVITPDVLSGM